MADNPGCYVVKDERGVILARLYFNGERYQIFRYPACSLGTYLLVLDYLEGEGYADVIAK